MYRKCEKIFTWFQQVPVWVWLTGITLVSLLLKLLCRHYSPEVSRDGCLYVYLSQIWYDTGSFQGVTEAWKEFWLPPLPLYLMKCVMCAGLSAEASGVLLNMAAGTLTSLVIYGIAYEITQRKDISVCSALLAAFHPAINALSVLVQRDMIYLFFAGLTFWLLAAGVRRQKWYFWFLAGLPCSCAMLTRFETVEILAIVPLSLLLLSIRKIFSWKKTVFYAVLFFAGFSCCTLALSNLMQTQDYLIKNYKRYFASHLANVKKQIMPDSKGGKK